MQTFTQIRNDLRDIRYYYSRKKVFEDASQSVGCNSIQRKIKKYNELICDAPPRLYDLYISLYLGNNTQETLSEKLGYTIEHICRLNIQLVKYFQKRIEETEQ